LKMALRNKLNSQEGRGENIRAFPIGSYVITWEPNSGDITGAKTKRFRFRWEETPVKVLRRLNDNSYELQRKPKDNNTEPWIVNTNRMWPFVGWTDTTPSTAPPFYGNDYIPYEQTYPNGPPTLVNGNLFILGLDPTPEMPLPFGVGKVITKHRNGTITFQWMGNDNDDFMGKYKLAWYDPNGHRDALPYYRDSPTDLKHKAYTNVHTDSVVRADMAAVPRFELAAGRIPHDVLKVLHRDDDFKWVYPLYNLPGNEAPSVFDEN
jgi:hypothetical protein